MQSTDAESSRSPFGFCSGTSWGSSSALFPPEAQFAPLPAKDPQLPALQARIRPSASDLQSKSRRDLRLRRSKIQCALANDIESVYGVDRACSNRKQSEILSARQRNGQIDQLERAFRQP